MFNLFLNAIRLITSKDVRESSSALLDFVKRSPEWQRDICVIEAQVSQKFQEQAVLLSGLVISKMTVLEYPKEARTAFESIYFELVTNGFEHGCANQDDSIKIALDVTDSFVAITVVNPPGRWFDLDRLLEDRTKKLKTDPSSPRGRGLILTSELADKFDYVENGRGVKALIYGDRVAISVIEIDGLGIIRVDAGVYNPSFRRRLLATAIEFSRLDLILDFSSWPIGSAVSRTALDVRELYEGSDRKLVAIVPYGAEGFHVRLPKDFITRSWKDALQKVGKSNLQSDPEFQDFAKPQKLT